MIEKLKDIWTVLDIEVRRVFHDPTVLLIFFIAPLIYPLLFCAIYHNENVENMPIAVVNESPCDESKRFIHKLEATPELHVAYKCNNLEQAKQLMSDHKVRSIFYFTKDFSQDLAEMRTGHIVVFSDMSSFYYYKAALTGGNAVLIDEMQNIELERYEMAGLTDKEASIQMQPVVMENTTLFNPSGGYGSFFLPVLLVLVIHQTLFLGICILAGDTMENRKYLQVIPKHLRRKSVHRVTLGRSLCYLFLYVPLVIFNFWFIPLWFHLPQLGNLYTILIFALPLLLAIIFFSMTVATLFVRQKISPMLCFIFFSLVLFMLTGMVWPQNSLPGFWHAFSYIFPSTPGVQGFVKITSMGAQLAEVRHEYITLWIQAGIYFSTATLITLAKNLLRQRRNIIIHRIRTEAQELIAARQNASNKD